MAGQIVTQTTELEGIMTDLHVTILLCAVVVSSNSLALEQNRGCKESAVQAKYQFNLVTKIEW